MINDLGKIPIHCKLSISIGHISLEQILQCSPSLPKSGNAEQNSHNLGAKHHKEQFLRSVLKSYGMVKSVTAATFPTSLPGWLAVSNPQSLGPKANALPTELAPAGHGSFAFTLALRCCFSRYLELVGTSNGGNITVGQIQTISNTSEVNMDVAVKKAWYAQSENYDFTSNTCATLGECDKYKQVRDRVKPNEICLKPVLLSYGPFSLSTSCYDFKHVTLSKLFIPNYYFTLNILVYLQIM